MMEEEKKGKRGGARKGAGRKRTVSRSFCLCATPEVERIVLSSGKGISEFLSECVLFWAAHHKDAAH